MATERPLLSISRKTLDEGPKEIRAALPAAWLSKTLEEGLSASTDGSVDVRITPSGGDNFLVQGSVKATVDATCGRCLGPAHIPVATQMTLILVPEHAAKGRKPKGKTSKDSEGEFEFDKDEADVATYDGDTVVLDELVREAIILELPISPLCSEDCAGMRSDPAFPRETAEALERAKIDPRLAPLAALRDKLKK
ncbi:MAG: YceD family protein [Polyangiales bacterium]